MTVNEAKKIKEYITDYVDAPIRIFGGHVIQVDVSDSACIKGKKIQCSGRIYTIRQFKYADGTMRNDAIIPQQVATHARLRLDNGVKERNMAHVGMMLEYNCALIQWDDDTIKKLDEIIDADEFIWGRVTYRDGGLHIVDEDNDSICLAHPRGHDIYMQGVQYKILGYNRTQNKDNLLTEPIASFVGEFYNYCLLRRL